MGWASVYMIGAAAAGAAVASAQKNPKIGDPTQPALPPQASKSPTAADTRTGVAGRNQAAGSPGIAQTMLTGPAGVNNSQLTLGRNTLLGG